MLTPGSLAEAMAAATQREWIEGPELEAGLARAQAVEALMRLASRLAKQCADLTDLETDVLTQVEYWSDAEAWNMECQVCGHRWFRVENNSEAVPCPKRGA